MAISVLREVPDSLTCVTGRGLRNVDARTRVGALKNVYEAERAEEEAQALAAEAAQSAMDIEAAEVAHFEVGDEPPSAVVPLGANVGTQGGEPIDPESTIAVVVIDGVAIPVQAPPAAVSRLQPEIRVDEPGDLVELEEPEVVDLTDALGVTSFPMKCRARTLVTVHARWLSAVTGVCDTIVSLSLRQALRARRKVSLRCRGWSLITRSPSGHLRMLRRTNALRGVIVGTQCARHVVTLGEAISAILAFAT